MEIGAAEASIAQQQSVEQAQRAHATELQRVDERLRASEEAKRKAEIEARILVEKAVIEAEKKAKRKAEIDQLKQKRSLNDITNARNISNTVDQKRILSQLVPQKMRTGRALSHTPQNSRMSPMIAVDMQTSALIH